MPKQHFSEKRWGFLITVRVYNYLWNGTKDLPAPQKSYCQSTKLRYKSGKKIHKIVFMENQIEANGE